LQSNKHFKDLDRIDKTLLSYKNNPSHEGLELLYEELDSIITTITVKISSGFRKKNQNDFLDLQQEVRINIFTHLNKLAEISEDANNLVAIIVKGCVWSCRANYRKHKKSTPVKWNDSPSISFSSWLYEHEIPIQVGVAVALGDMDTSTESDTYGTLKAAVWQEPVQLAHLQLQALPELLTDTALALNRFASKAGMIKFCLGLILEGRTPSTLVLEKKWGDSNGKFYVEYATLLFKLALIEVQNSV